ncbi:unnamed protein product [Orchesella dallaii]|uniref:Uncharacterized protein n=1 Tax=Orchesella dallaii TaxID=48710 RepID=A0ABP1RJQ7_9HEXA
MSSIFIKILGCRLKCGASSFSQGKRFLNGATLCLTAAVLFAALLYPALIQLSEILFEYLFVPAILFLCTICFTAVYCINTALLHTVQIMRAESDRTFTARQYREIQILALLSNQCFQNFVWINVQYGGGALIILVFYSLIVGKDVLSFGILALMIILLITLVIFVLLVVDYASRPIAISQQFLNEWTRTATTKWRRKCGRSLRPIALHVGPFHKLGRGQVPITIRTCVQRTFHLVAQSNAI